MLGIEEEWKMVKLVSPSSILLNLREKVKLRSYNLQFRSLYTNLNSFVSSIISTINSCSTLSSCRGIHARVVKSLVYRQGFIGDQLVSCYNKLGDEKDAEKLFDEMPEKDLVSWNSLISGFSRSGQLGKCLNVFYRMRLEMGVEANEVTLISVISSCTDGRASDEGRYVHGIVLKLGMFCEVKIGNALINLYGKCGCLGMACSVFETMVFRNLVTWNSMIAMYTQNGFAKEGMGMFDSMMKMEIRPDQASILTVLQACEDVGIGKVAEMVHGLIVRCGLIPNVAVLTALVNLYAKLGRLFASQKVFSEIIDPDRVAWTAMLAAYAMHGCGREAIEIFELMIKASMLPDHVTFTHLLSACAHSGLVDEGKIYFNAMSEIYKVEPRLDHYSCMVDLLGRSGYLNEAYELIEQMPMEPNSGVWGALLGACRVHKNTDLGKKAAEKLFSLEPTDSRNYTLLSNIYSAAGMWKEASEIKALIKDRGLIRTPGCSYIEHEDKIHRFLVGDNSHPMSEKIYRKLEELIGKIKTAGFIPKTEYVLHDVDEEVKVDMINKHSEKLAIAFGLLVINPNLPLIITKNLRICGDCHEMARFVSLIEKRIIIIRDSKRFHHFVNGACSCGDYW